MKIVITDSKTISDDSSFFEPLREMGELVLYDLSKKEQIPERIREADVVLCNKTALGREELQNATNIKYIGLFATGFNNIDTEYTNEHGIAVCNAGSYSTEAVAQHTFALILNHFSRILDYANFVKQDGWKESKVFSPFVYPLFELTGKNLGIVGYGSIGKRVSEIGQAFGMNVYVYTRTKREVPGIHFVDWDTFLAKSDIISVHCPLNKESELLFDENAFSHCKKGCFFVNTARGAIVDEDALYDALEKEQLSGAGIDVLTEEPMARDSRLTKAKNITITPHVAWTPVETRERLFEIVCENIRKFKEGHPQNVVGMN